MDVRTHREKRKSGGRVLKKGLLVLEDGSIFPGYLFGFLGDSKKTTVAPWLGWGELVFNTAMTGYEEVLTDPSYLGQIVVMTCAHVGNYGITLADQESSKAHLSGFVVRELTWTPSNWRSRISLNDYLVNQKIPGLSAVDTRALALVLRDRGAMRAAIVDESIIRNKTSDVKRIIKALQEKPSMEGLGLASHVSIKAPRVWDEGLLESGTQREFSKVAVWDFGTKWNILRELRQLGHRSVVYPWNSSAQDLMSQNPLGIVLSNGPGDPAALPSVIEEIKRLLDMPQRPPILGICLGHQLLALACGARTYKMKFGHHGINHPVQEISSGRTLISSHNHGFAVDPKTFQGDMRATYVSLNDQTVEGFESVERQVTAVQFHPESAPGPSEARGVFKRFRDLVQKT